MEVDVTKKEILLPLNKIDVAFGTEQTKWWKQILIQRNSFLENDKFFSIKNFGQVSFLCYVLARSLSFLDPRKMFSADVCVKRPKQCMRIFTQVGHLKENEADKIKRQYIKFIHLYEENPYFKISIFLKTESVWASLWKKWQRQGFLICGC